MTTIPPVAEDNSIPDDATCQEASDLSVNSYIPCGAPAAATVYHKKDRRSYYICRPAPITTSEIVAVGW
jgi:hypothetical protein